MDTPLTRWYCDVCKKPIEDIDRGYVIWRSDEAGKDRDFKIIHQIDCDIDSFPSSLPLRDFLGPRGLVVLTSLLSPGPIKMHFGPGYNRVADMDGLVDLMRRVQVPHYEEARHRLFSNEKYLDDNDDANEVGPYLVDQLRAALERYGK